MWWRTQNELFSGTLYYKRREALTLIYSSFHEDRHLLMGHMIYTVFQERMTTVCGWARKLKGIRRWKDSPIYSTTSTGAAASSTDGTTRWCSPCCSIRCLLCRYFNGRATNWGACSCRYSYRSSPSCGADSRRHIASCTFTFLSCIAHVVFLVICQHFSHCH